MREAVLLRLCLLVVLVAVGCEQGIAVTPEIKDWETKKIALENAMKQLESASVDLIAATKTWKDSTKAFAIAVKKFETKKIDIVKFAHAHLKYDNGEIATAARENWGKAKDNVVSLINS